LHAIEQHAQIVIRLHAIKHHVQIVTRLHGFDAIKSLRNSIQIAANERFWLRLTHKRGNEATTKEKKAEIWMRRGTSGYMRRLLQKTDEAAFCYENTVQEAYCYKNTEQEAYCYKNTVQEALGATVKLLQGRGLERD